VTLTLLLLSFVALLVLAGTAVVVWHAAAGRELEDELAGAAEREPAVVLSPAVDDDIDAQPLAA
jgi:hypothetical protein